MMGAIYLVFWCLIIGFWLIQVIDLLLRDVTFFESHTHKLVWFLVLFAGNLVGAIWYYLWKRQAERMPAPNK